MAGEKVNQAENAKDQNAAAVNPASEEATVNPLEAENAQLLEENEQQRNVIAEQSKTISELLERLKSQTGSDTIELKTTVKKVEKPVIPAPVKFDGKQYKFKFAAFYFKGERLVSEDVAIDPEKLQEILNEPGQGILYQIF